MEGATVNITQLRAFVAVVEHGSFSEAAKAVGLSQPAVTMQIQGLESDLGVTLLDRRYRKVDLTEPGKALIPVARHVLEELDDARLEIGRLSDTVGGHLEIAVSTTPGQYIVPRMLGSYLAMYPEVSVSLRVYDTADVIERVESGEAHLGVTGARIAGSKVEFQQAGDDTLVLICPPECPLAGRTDLTLTDVAEQRFIMRETGSGTRLVFEQALRNGGVDPAELDVVMELGTSEAVVNAVEGGMGIGVVSHWMADKALALGTVTQVAAPDFPITRPLYLVKPRGVPSRAAEALVDHLTKTMALPVR